MTESTVAAAARHLTGRTALLAFLAGSCVALPARAGTTFDVIGPHEYDLPVDFEPFNVFVQYAYIQQNDHVLDADGDKQDGDGSETLVGQSKYVRFWTPKSHPNVGLAWEIIVPEISLRHVPTENGDRQISGIGDPLTGFAIWTRPAEKLVVGFQSFAQIPVGATDVSDTNWKNLSSFFIDWALPAGFNWTADAGAVFQGSKDNGSTPGTSYHTNQRLSYKVTTLLEPFIGLDAEYTDAHDDLPHGWAVDGGVGLMFHTFDNQSITVRYSGTLDGANHGVNDSVNLKYAYAW